MFGQYINFGLLIFRLQIPDTAGTTGAPAELENGQAIRGAVDKTSQHELVICRGRQFG